MISPLVGEDSNHGGNEELFPATNQGGNLQFGLRVSISTCVRRIIWFGPAAGGIGPDFYRDPKGHPSASLRTAPTQVRSPAGCGGEGIDLKIDRVTQTKVGESLNVAPLVGDQTAASKIWVRISSYHLLLLTMIGIINLCRE